MASLVLAPAGGHSGMGHPLGWEDCMTCSPQETEPWLPDTDSSRRHEPFFQEATGGPAETVTGVEEKKICPYLSTFTPPFL